MSDTNKDAVEPSEKPNPPHKKNRAKEIANTFEWLITAFILAFVFRAFVMEAFRIPTGSMADTLHGAHFRLRCPQCSFKHHRGFTPQRYGKSADVVPSYGVPLHATKCPSCGWLERHQTHRPVTRPVENGDRILVLKCQYQFFNPKRYDVIVFKNPENPTEDYIKRLIGLPGDKIEIVDGDVFINDHIARKPAMVQKEHWMPVYDNDYQPLEQDTERYNGHTWVNPFLYHPTLWQIKDKDPARFHLNTQTGEDAMLRYGAPSANDFRATYAYNDAISFANMPVCSDIKVEGIIQSHSEKGRFGASLKKFGVAYKGWVDFDGRLVIASLDVQNNFTILAEQNIEISNLLQPKSFEFATVDRQLLLQYGTHTLTHDLGTALKSLEYHREYAPEAAFFGTGQLTLAHTTVSRDSYYTERDSQNRKAPRAVEGKPFQLNEDEFFVMGDNSPNSHDGRWWPEPTMVTRGQTPPRAGVVPREYLVGKAMFVYWPSGYKFPWPEKLLSMIQKGSQNNRLLGVAHLILNLKWIPNLGQMRYIYGGSSATKISQTQDVNSV